AGIAAHGAAVLLGSLVVLEHRLDDEGGEVAFFGVGAFAQPGEIILRDFDRRVGHQVLGRALNGGDGNHVGFSYSAATLSRSSVSPGRTSVNSTGASVISRPSVVCRATVKREAAKSPGSGKSEREFAPREFSPLRAASAITRLTSVSERRLSQSCQVKLKARPSSATPLANSSVSMASSTATARSRPAPSRTTPTSSHIVSRSFS